MISFSEILFHVMPPKTNGSEAPPHSLSKIYEDSHARGRLSSTFHRLILPGDVELNVTGSTSLEAIADNYAVNVARIIKAHADAHTAANNDKPYVIKLRTGGFNSTAYYKIPLTLLYKYALGLPREAGEATEITLPDGRMLTVTGETTFKKFADDFFAEIQKSPAIVALCAQKQNAIDEAVLSIQHVAKGVCPFDQTDESLKPVAEALLPYMELIARDMGDRDKRDMDRSGIDPKKLEVSKLIKPEGPIYAGLGRELDFMADKLAGEHVIGKRDIKIIKAALEACYNGVARPNIRPMAAAGFSYAIV